MKNVALLMVVSILSGCGNLASDSLFTQVDRMGRPGISLFITDNANLKVFNALIPSADLTELNDDAMNDLQVNWGLIGTYATANGMTPVPYDTFTGGFFPDVMRIDTDIAFSGFTIDSVSTSTDGHLMLTGGRKLTEDVMDVMLSYAFDTDTGGTTIQDSVTYNGPGAGVNPRQPGHQALLSDFPYLAPPN